MKSSHLFALHFYTVLIMQSNANSLPISYNFLVMLLLVNVMFPSELSSNPVNLASKPNGF